MTSDLDGIDAQARDISFLVGYAQTLSNTDLSEVAVVGFSWGGLSNLFAAARDNRIDALVALDGSLRYVPGLVKQAGDVHPHAMTIPLLAFFQQDFSLEDQARYVTDAQREGPNVLNAWTHGDLITAHMLGLVHWGHSSMYQRNEDMWADYFPEQQRGDYDREDAIENYAWVARYTLQFLNAYLRHDAAAMTYLKKTPAENGVPRHLMAVKYRAAEGMPASFESFRAEVGHRDFNRAADILLAFRKQDSDFRLDETAINSWSDELISDSHLPEAIALLELNVQMYPDSSSTYTSLGDAYRAFGQKRLAIESYQKALEKIPDNILARRKLENRISELERSLAAH